MLFYHCFHFKNFVESAKTKGLRQCHDAPCIVNDGQPTFPYFFVSGAPFRRKAAFVGFPMLKHKSFQSRFLSMVCSTFRFRYAESERGLTLTPTVLITPSHYYTQKILAWIWATNYNIVHAEHLAIYNCLYIAWVCYFIDQAGELFTGGFWYCCR